MREHLEFLDLLRRRGLLVAGGPRPDQPGTGMLLIRGVDADEAPRLATVEDQASSTASWRSRCGRGGSW
jgi:uncharacterized protein YciI